MATLDSHVSTLLDTHPDHSSEDEDALIASLEDDTSSHLLSFREQRIEQLHAELSRAKAQKASGYGCYTTIESEKELMDLTTSCPLAIVHFSKEDFARCGTMNTHLEALAKKHLDTRFLKIEVENAPFLVTKLAVKVLPCIICWVSGKSVDRVVGFEGLGYTQDTFTTMDLETRFLASGVLLRGKVSNGEGFGTASGVKWRTKEQSLKEEDDDDWD